MPLWHRLGDEGPGIARDRRCAGDPGGASDVLCARERVCGGWGVAQRLRGPLRPPAVLGGFGLGMWVVLEEGRPRTVVGGGALMVRWVAS